MKKNYEKPCCSSMVVAVEQAMLGDSRYLVGIGIYFGKPKKKETFIYNSS